MSAFPAGEIEEWEEKQSVKNLQEKIEKELRAIAFQNPANYLERYTDENGEMHWRPKAFEKLTPRAKRAVERIEIKKDGSVEYKMFSKFKAFEMLQKLHPAEGEAQNTELSEGDRELLRKVSRRCERED